MKRLFFAIALFSCGDNIHPEDPDPVVDETGPEGDLDIKPEDLDAGMPDPDAGVQCDDKHADLNGHDHRCQHD